MTSPMLSWTVVVFVLVVLFHRHSAAAASLVDAVSVDGILAHLEALQEIARRDGRDSRSINDNYNASAEYVVDQLRAVGCEPAVHYLVAPVHSHIENAFLELVSPVKLVFQYGSDYAGMRYGGSGVDDFTERVAPIPNYGCDESDFASFPAGAIALIAEGGDCEIVTKAFLAEDAGASAILFSSAATRTGLLTSRVRIVDWKDGDRLVETPCIAVSYLVGQVLTEFEGGAYTAIRTNQLLTVDPTYNVLCDSHSGNTSSIVVVGAHLDSVPEGPGLNDNGSGSASVLEIALQFFKLGLNPVNAVRFAWWGAEEVGLLGSRAYCRDGLNDDPDAFNDIALYINLDMAAAPNYISYVHDGYQVNDNIPEEIKQSSRVIQHVIEEFFIARDLPYKLNGMTGGSDYLPFLESGIPSSGCATGASGIKTDAERSEFGGFANAQMDPCYHLACDTLDNINTEALETISGAITYAVEYLFDQEDLRDFLGGSASDFEKRLRR